MIRFFRFFDPGLAIAILFLLCISLATLTGIGARDSDYRLLIRQSVWAVIGVAIFAGLSLVDYRVLRGARSLIFNIYLAGAAALISVLSFGAQIRGATSWFRIGWLTIEPVEFIKIVLIIVLAQYFSLRHIESYRISHILVSALYAGVYILLIFLQPDMGSAIVLLGIWLGVVIMSGMKIKQFLTLALVGALLFMLGWGFHFADYQKERIVSFLRPGYDLQGTGYNVRQAQIAIGAGGLWGSGIAGGSQVQLYFLPEAETDFVLAAIGEYFGFLGIFLVITAIGYILFWVFLNAKRSQNNFARLAGMGFFFLLFIQSSIHIGMNLGIFPVTGVPLPLVSYGGSSLISTLFGIGLVQSIAIRNKLRYPEEVRELG